MEYTIKQLADLAGVSTRTLRYYDQIDLLKPKYNSKNNYRIYGEKQIDRLQQILFYRALEFSLSKIKQLMNDDDYSELTALKEQQELLVLKQRNLDELLNTVNATIKAKQEKITMTDNDKFEAFKNIKIKENESEFGKEIRDKYGDDVVDESNHKFAGLRQVDIKKMKKIEEDMFVNLLKVDESDLDSVYAKLVYEDHKKWLSYSLPNYSASTHRGLVDMYITDKRFSDYYNNKANKPVVQLLRDVVYHYTK
ncbi:MerR family transcriptional regulator [Companilactobacillus allii]|uniref:MerR family transcriptional regulator n=1 Tax=Companilactobacillus allii TaxID=1847728 RepID=A0A1P8Q0Z1_9LACO|nr:MerR family transcriptional regulator [Companilactobacillus allii]APX71543.1 MerR family transcriptional regulator [Companilactobacillus allii]USQ68626.1 MerR family transcriptional regulator [Companilactobacillus allii]